MSGGTKVAYDELYSTDYENHTYDQHVRFLIDLDKVLTLNHKVIKTFIKYFTEMLLHVLDEYPDDNIQIYNILSVGEIIQGARVAIKSNRKKLGIDIYFASIITHAMNFRNLASVVRKIRMLGLLQLGGLGFKVALQIITFVAIRFFRIRSATSKPVNLGEIHIQNGHVWFCFLDGLPSGLTVGGLAHQFKALIALEQLAAIRCRTTDGRPR